MKFRRLILPLVFAGVILSARGGGYFTQEWAIKASGGEDAAREIAANAGLEFLRQIGSLEGTYLLTRNQEDGEIATREFEDVTEELLRDKRVTWAQQQSVERYISRSLTERTLQEEVKRLYEMNEVKHVHDINEMHSTEFDAQPMFNDPLFIKQWYLLNNGQNGAVPGLDLNVIPAWKLGYTGKGVVVTIVDDGLDGTHPDLIDNFDINASFDFNNKSGTDRDPHPDDSPSKGSENAHGTKCGGEVAATANNSICGVGVAYESRIGGMRILDGPVTESMEAEALLYNSDYIDIYSCSWGPRDDGTKFTTGGVLLNEAFEKGVMEGRNGKGSIYVWASGNGGYVLDHCGADGYVNRPETIAIGALGDHGFKPVFGELCSATMAVALSGSSSVNKVSTTDLHGNCYDRFSGTSSSAPLAAGVFAILLQANPSLTWRDVQHLITQGCSIPTPNDDGWHVNGAGFHLNHKFGFGSLDTSKMVELALTWTNVGPRQVCEVEAGIEINVVQGQSRAVSFMVQNCLHIKHLEHTIAHITLQTPRRGNIRITMHSPYGTMSELIGVRPKDTSDEGYVSYPFMSVHNWGENPDGTWIIVYEHHETPPDAPKQNGASGQNDSTEEKVARLKLDKFTFYGTMERAFFERESSGTSRERESREQGWVYQEHAGESDKQAVVDMYNEEHREQKEITVGLGDLADGIQLPPNMNLNLNDQNEINTGEFDHQ